MDSTPNVIPIPLGLTLGGLSSPPFVRAYLVRSGNNWALVDTGPPGNAGRILQILKRHGVQDRLRLILLTHGHFDHYGSALELQHLLRGRVPIVLHSADACFLRGERWPSSLRFNSVPGALSLALGAGSMLLLHAARRLPPWSAGQPDNVFWLEGGPVFDLRAQFDFAGTVHHTPGHSPGSLSLRLPTGEMLVGDVVSAGLRRTLPRWPMLFESSREVAESWRRIARLDPTTLYPGHGGPFSGADFRKLAENLTTTDV